jgi:hypothetical protein
VLPLIADTPLRDFVIDFALHGDRVWVIEINPLFETTDGVSVRCADAHFADIVCRRCFTGPAIVL